VPGNEGLINPAAGQSQSIGNRADKLSDRSRSAQRCKIDIQSGCRTQSLNHALPHPLGNFAPLKVAKVRLLKVMAVSVSIPP